MNCPSIHESTSLSAIWDRWDGYQGEVDSSGIDTDCFLGLSRASRCAGMILIGETGLRMTTANLI